MKPGSRRRLDWRTIAVLVGAFVVVALLWSTPVVWPLRVLVVFFHEASHGLAAVATGGAIDSLRIMPDESGLATTRGGSTFVVYSAGYLGSLAFGAVILVVAARTRRDRIAAAVLGALLAVLTILFVPFANPFGFAFGLIAAAALIAIARWLPAAASDVALKVIGVTSCGYAVLDIYEDVIARPALRSDAAMLGAATGVPTVVWGALWIALAIGGAGFALWLAARGDGGGRDGGAKEG
jgi:hypothetical protein